MLAKYYANISEQPDTDTSRHVSDVLMSQSSAN